MRLEEGKQYRRRVWEAMKRYAGTSVGIEAVGARVVVDVEGSIHYCKTMIKNFDSTVGPWPLCDERQVLRGGQYGSFNREVLVVDVTCMILAYSWFCEATSTRTTELSPS